MATTLKMKMDPDAAMLASGPPDEATATPAEMAHWGRLVGQKLNAIEGNPLTAEDVAMFKMFEKEGWSHDQCIAHILDDARKKVQDASR